MGLCISRRAVDASNGNESSQHQESFSKSSRGVTDRSSSSSLHPARLLLDSPRISTDISDMGMLGLLFHKRYCCKSLPGHQSSSGGYQKLAADVPLVIQQNALFEEQRQDTAMELDDEGKEDKEGGGGEDVDDGYPAFQPNSRAAAAIEQPVTLAAVAAAIKEGSLAGSVGRGVWQSAGEDFYSDWEERSTIGAPPAPAPAPSQPTPPPPPPPPPPLISVDTVELGVFDAEEYFKEDVSRSEEVVEPPGSSTKSTVEEDLISIPVKSEQRCLSSRSTSSCSSSVAGGGGGWASLCAGSGSVEIDHKGKKSARSMKNKADKHISKVLKLLASPSSHHQQQQQQQQTSPPRTSSSKPSENRKHHKKKARIAETQVKEWMDRARKSLDNSAAAAAADQKNTNPSPVTHDQEHSAANLSRLITPCEGGGGFGSPLPSSPKEQQSPLDERKDDQGNESDSSSDLFELDSVATSLSSARSSLSRLSSARSSVRKSTVDEQDMLHITLVPSSDSGSSSRAAVVSEVIHQSHHCKKSNTRRSDKEEFDVRAAATAAPAAAAGTNNGSNAAVLIMKNRRSKMSCLDAGPLLSIVEESRPASVTSSPGRRRVATVF